MRIDTVWQSYSLYF